MEQYLVKLDRSVAIFMKRWGYSAVRLSFAVIFIWFGILKPLGLSTAAPLVLKTVSWLPFLSPESWLSVIGWWEVAIGLLFIFKSTTRLAIAFLLLQMSGTFMPLFMLPEITFQGGNYLLPTMEGQYIIKNLMIIAGAMVIGGTVYKKNAVTDG